MKFKNGLAGILALGSLLAAGTAQADIIKATFSGVLLDAASTGTFGLTGDISGDAFTATFLFDSLTPAINGSDPTYPNTTLYGGSAFPAPSPVSGALTVNGVTVSFAGTYASQEYLANGESGTFNAKVDEVYYYVTPDGNSDLYAYVRSFYDNFITSLDPRQPIDYDVAALDDPVGAFFYSDQNGSAEGNLVLSHVSTADLTTADPVPEPLTLSLFGAGLAGAVAMRRRKKGAA